MSIHEFHSALNRPSEKPSIATFLGRLREADGLQAAIRIATQNGRWPIWDQGI